MQISKTKKLFTGFLAVLLLMSTFAAVPVSAASDTDGTAMYSGNLLDDFFHDNLAAGDAGLPYLEYVERNPAALPSESIVINAVDYDVEHTDAKVEVLENFEGVSGQVLYMPENGTTSWKVSVDETAKYAIRITYFPIAEKDGVTIPTYTTIERTLYIDGYIPFSEARYFYFPRNWAYTPYEYREDGTCIFPTDATGNDVRPIRIQKPEWQTYYLRDWLGYTMEPFQFTLSKGEHVISFEANREPIVISKIELYAYEGEPTYAEFLAEKQAQGVKVIDKVEGGVIKVQAEDPTLISNASLFPTNDRTSSLTEPQNPQQIRYNMVNGGTVNQWMKYTVTVPEEGLYKIAIRFRQNDLLGMFTSRRILINDEIQFEEASRIRFKYRSGWQSTYATNGQEEFLFYFKEGENTVTFETVLGDMTTYVYEIGNLIDELNGAYKQILQLTGPTPDANRDYGFTRLVPEAVQTIVDAADELYRIADELEAVTGELGDQVATLNTIAMLFEKMEDEYEIAPNFVTFKNYIIALSNWLYASLNQPLKMDYFTIQGTEDAKPKASANFFEVIWFEIKAFIGSFFMDYTTVDFKSEDGVEYERDMVIEQWITSALGREDALIQRGLIDEYFTNQTGIAVKMKVITTGLTEAILAGIGPDIAGMGSVDTITWGLRNAVEPLDEFDGFYEYTDPERTIYWGEDETETASEWFSEAAITPLQMKDAHGETHTYGLPATMDFYMMFYRSDVLYENGVKVPKTWQDLYDILPALQSADLEIGMPGAVTGAVDGLTGLKIFLYQMGGELYTEDGYAVALEENVALDAFESLCGMFSKYKCPVNYDLTRFRTGEIPIFFGAAVGTYNTLMTYYDIRGLWEMAPLLGVEDQFGEINYTSFVTVSSRVIPRGATNPDATWEYMMFLSCPNTQKLLAKEQIMVNANPTIKYNSPTIEALLDQAWTESERAAIEAQTSQLVGIPEYPGNYIIGTYVNSAFLNVYNTSSDAAEQLQDRVVYINKEIARKRDDFKMDYIDIKGKYHSGRFYTNPLYANNG